MVSSQMPSLSHCLTKFRVQRGLIHACIMAKNVMHAYLFMKIINANLHFVWLALT